jgi:quercetin dioxygenase-like cupin family protein
MNSRNKALSEFITAHKTVVDTLTQSSIKTFLTRCHTSLSKSGEPTCKDVSNLEPVCKYIPESLKLARNQSPELIQLAQKFDNLYRHLPWYPSNRSSDKNEAFYNGHANAVITGNGGLEEHKSVRFGASLIAPHLEYPYHRHPPEEGYLVISEGDWRQGSGGWFHRNPGETVHNVPNIWHAMKSGKSPLLAVWMLWTE